MSDNTSNTESRITCDEHRQQIIAGLEPFQILSLAVPMNNTAWIPRDEVWDIFFLVYVAVISAIFLKLGIASIVLLIKKDCIRLPTKTFFAIYLSLAILSFSRVLFLVLDNFSILGFISEHFPAWFIVSRLLGSLGTPSIVASTTLMIFTMIKIAKAVPGKQWYHYWKFVIPILLTPYIIAFVSEIIGNFSPYPGLLIIAVCEFVFALWGLAMCVAFLIAGNRLLRQLQLREKKTIRISTVRAHSKRSHDRELDARQQFALREQHRHHIKTRRITRKITIITYVTASITIVYSILSIGGAIKNLLFVYFKCLGLEGRGHPATWLTFEISKRINEIVLACILLYSITDISGVLKLMFGRCCMKTVKQTKVSSIPKAPSQMSDLSLTGSDTRQHSIGNSIQILPSSEFGESGENIVEVVQVHDESTSYSHPFKQEPDRPQYLFIPDSQSNDHELEDTFSPYSTETAEMTFEDETPVRGDDQILEERAQTETVEMIDIAVQTEPEDIVNGLASQTVQELLNDHRRAVLEKQVDAHLQGFTLTRKQTI